MKNLSLKVLLLVLSIGTFVCGNQYLNVKYRDIVEGKIPLTNQMAIKIYSQFQGTFEKSDYRFKVFKNILTEIRNHNMGKYSWQQGINEFSDMTFQEFKQIKLMAPQNCSATNSLRISKKKEAPAEYEWNSLGMVTPVKNQGNCGSCWSFSTVGAMQSHWNILGKGKNLTFSQQQLVDCASAFANHGCNGGLPSQAFEYIKYAGGLQSQVSYPYTAKTGQCKFNKNLVVAYVKYGSYNITQGDEVELAQRLYAKGPMSVAFQVITGFQSYKSGIYTSTKCGKTSKDVNHAVLATGYGVLNNQPFWNIKNSWGPTWGVKGYFMMTRGANMCAVAQCNAYPLIETPTDLEEIKNQ